MQLSVSQCIASSGIFLGGIAVSIGIQLSGRWWRVEGAPSVRENEPAQSVPAAPDANRTAAFPDPAIPEDDDLRLENRWKAVFARGSAILSLPADAEIGVVRGAGLKQDCREFFLLASQLRAGDAEDVGGAEPPEQVSALADWRRHPVGAIRAVRSYRVQVGEWTEVEWTCATEAASAAVAFRRDETLKCLPDLHARLRDFVEGLLAGDHAGTDPLATLGDLFRPYDERWAALVSVPSGAEEDERWLEGAAALGWEETVAGTSLHEVFERCRSLPPPIADAALRGAMDVTAKASPFELSEFVDTLLPGTPMRLYGMERIVEEVGADTPEGAAWQAQLEAEQNP